MDAWNGQFWAVSETELLLCEREQAEVVGVGAGERGVGVPQLAAVAATFAEQQILPCFQPVLLV